MKGVWFIALMLLMVAPVLANTATVTVLADVDCTGGVMRISSPGTSDWGDKIYPVPMVRATKGICVMEFNVETGLSKVDFQVILTNNGETATMVEQGPFMINGSDIFLDDRAVIAEQPIEEEVVEEVEVNETEEVVENEAVVVEEIVEEVEINETEGDSVMGGIVDKVTGFVVSDEGKLMGGSYVLVGFGVLAGGLLLFMIVRKAYKSGAKAELKELGKMELDSKLDELDD